ncbi:MAG: nucleotidyltransferase family protein [Gammaproteobacteria bacterium]
MTDPVGILLAAGSATRFGSAKLLHPLSGGELIGVAAARALISALPNSLAVVQPGNQVLINAFSDIGLQVVENPLAESGMGSSLAAGVNAASGADGWLIALADMPWIQPATMTALADRLKRGASMIAPVYRGRRGHPVGFSSRWGEQLRGLSGDRGARDLISNYPGEVELFDTADSGVLKDVDHPHDLNR